MRLLKAESSYQKSLTINGDFQINQRGQTVYNGDNTKNTYTVDMWRTVTTASTITSKVEVIDNGIRFSSTGTGNANFEQILECSSSNGYVGITEISNLIGSGVFAIDYTDGTSWEEKELENGINFLLSPKGKIPRRFIIRLKDTASVEIKFGRLYEGNITYKGQKEDYATALDRCLHKFVKGSLCLSIYALQQGTSYYAFGVYNTPTVMDNVPTLKIIRINVVNVGNVPNDKISNPNVNERFIGSTWVIDVGTNISIDKYQTTPIFVEFELSCEPLS